MNEFRIRETGQVVDEGVFRQMHSGTSFPAVLGIEVLEAYEVDPVLAFPPPTTTAFQSAVRDGAVQDSLGNWVQAWAVEDWSQEQIDAYKASSALARWEAIKVERDRREVGGVLVGTKWFHSDATSRIKQIALVMAGANLPAGLQWKTMDGSFVNMTQALAGQIFGASLAATSAIFAKAEEHKAAMEAAENPAVYDFSEGWPTIYTPSE